jgi:hypothetical protein
MTDDTRELVRKVADPRWLLSIIAVSLSAAFGAGSVVAEKIGHDAEQDKRIGVVEGVTTSTSTSVRYLVLQECRRDPKSDEKPLCNGSQ